MHALGLHGIKDLITSTQSNTAIMSSDIYFRYITKPGIHNAQERRNTIP